MTESTTIIRNTEKYLAKKFDNGKYGFVDQRGRKVIEPKFDSVNTVLTALIGA